MYQKFLSCLTLCAYCLFFVQCKKSGGGSSSTGGGQGQGPGGDPTQNQFVFRAGYSE